MVKSRLHNLYIYFEFLIFVLNHKKCSNSHSSMFYVDYIPPVGVLNWYLDRISIANCWQKKTFVVNYL